MYIRKGHWLEQKIFLIWMEKLQSQTIRRVCSFTIFVYKYKLSGLRLAYSSILPRRAAFGTKAKQTNKKTKNVEYTFCLLSLFSLAGGTKCPRLIISNFCNFSKQHSSYSNQTLWLFPKFIIEHFDVSTVWVRNLTFLWQPATMFCFQNLVFLKLKYLFKWDFGFYTDFTPKFLQFLYFCIFSDYWSNLRAVLIFKMADPKWWSFWNVT